MGRTAPVRSAVVLLDSADRGAGSGQHALRRRRAADDVTMAR
ncbi:hypothetical protein [Ruania albidiflava]|nr:hypothetical protein [Ruania albidiflava]